MCLYPPIEDVPDMGGLLPLGITVKSADKIVILHNHPPNLGSVPGFSEARRGSRYSEVVEASGGQEYRRIASGSMDETIKECSK